MFEARLDSEQTRPDLNAPVRLSRFLLIRNDGIGIRKKKHESDALYCVLNFHT